MRFLHKVLLLAWCLVIPPALCFAQAVYEAPDGVYTTREISERIDIGKNNKLLVRAASNLPGKFSITTHKADEVRLVYYKKARTEMKSDAIDYIDLIAVVLDRTPETVRLELRAPNPAPWSGDKEWGMVDAEIRVPENCFVHIEAPLFDVNAVGPLRGVEILSSLGRLDVSNVTGKLDISTTNRRVAVADISGDIAISTSNALLTAENLVTLDKRADIENEHGDIRIEGFTGEIKVENSYGRIHMSGFHMRGGRNIIRGMSGPIMLDIHKINKAQLRVTNRFEDIELSMPEESSIMFSLAVDEGGKIEVTNINFKTELIEHNRMNLISGSGESVITGSVRGRGNIYVRGIQ